MFQSYHSWFASSAPVHNNCTMSIYTVGNSNHVRLCESQGIVRLSVPRSKALILKSLAAINYYGNYTSSFLDQLPDFLSTELPQGVIYVDSCQDYDEAIISVQAEDAVLNEVCFTTTFIVVIANSLANHIS